MKAVGKSQKPGNEARLSVAFIYSLLFTFPAYTKNLLAQGVQMFPPQGFLHAKTGTEGEEVPSPPQREDSLPLDKSNILLLGPTGCGEYWGYSEAPVILQISKQSNIKVVNIGTGLHSLVPRPPPLFILQAIKAGGKAGATYN